MATGSQPHTTYAGDPMAHMAAADAGLLHQQHPVMAAGMYGHLPETLDVHAVGFHSGEAGHYTGYMPAPPVHGQPTLLPVTETGTGINMIYSEQLSAMPPVVSIEHSNSMLAPSPGPQHHQHHTDMATQGGVLPPGMDYIAARVDAAHHCDDEEQNGSPTMLNQHSAAIRNGVDPEDTASRSPVLPPGIEDVVTVVPSGGDSRTPATSTDMTLSQK
jgi:hypothetical protein